ncbi:MAG: iron-containing alcohol dehydrogenase family protein [Dehalococcoidia bacterium]
MTDPIAAFNNHLPVKIRFGEGVSDTLNDVVREVGGARAFVMLDEGIEKFNPAAAALVDQLKNDGGLETTFFYKPAGEPSIEMVDDAIVALTTSGAEVVIAIGGGSVIDTAKAARLCAEIGVDFRGFLASVRTYPSPARSLIALPTSAGTGSEVSGGAVIADLQNNTKSGIANPTLRPQYALVDPRLTYSMPPSMTANTGIDALAQAIAGMVAKVRTPIGDAIALESIRMMSRSLVKATQNGSDAAARADMAAGSMMAGLTMNISDCTAEHSLGQAIGGVKHVPHGLTIGLVLAETLDREAQHVPEQLERVADAMGVPADGTSDGSRCVAAIRQILKDLEFPVLRDVGVTEDELDLLTDLALQDFFITMSPVPWTRHEVYAAFHASYELVSR